MNLSSFRNRKLAGVIALMSLILNAGCATPTPEQVYEKNVSKGDDKMDQAFKALSNVDSDLEKNQVDKAEKAFNKAIGYVDQAVVYYAKAVTSPDQKEAVNDLKSGLAQMKTCVEKLENNDVAAADSAYAKAQQYFNDASTELWETG